jgi:hypothetical protein
MNKPVRGLFLAALLVAVSSAVDAQKAPAPLPAPTVRPAIDGILAGFQNHALVAIGNYEDYAQQEDFYAALMRDPRFAREVGNVVVEFGAGAHQDIMDRYLNGENVSFSDLRKVWTDIVGFNIPYAIGYVNFFVTVRDVNRTLPPGQRIHVWLGEPVIDWSKIKSKEELVKYYPQRDTHPIEIIEKEILAKNKKALVIYGDGHFYALKSLPSPGFPRLLPPLEQRHPGSIFIVQLYAGFATKDCADKFERGIQNWPVPAVATPIKGTSIGRQLYGSGCEVVDRKILRFQPGTTQAKKDEVADEIEQNEAGMKADALLYVGKAASLTQSPYEPSVYLDPDYLRELNRRATLGFGFNVGKAPMTDAIVKSNPVSPQFIRHY